MTAYCPTARDVLEAWDVAVCTHSPRHWRHRGPILGCTQCEAAIGYLCLSCKGSGGFRRATPTSHLIVGGCETCGGLGWIRARAEVSA